MASALLFSTEHGWASRGSRHHLLEEAVPSEPGGGLGWGGEYSGCPAVIHDQARIWLAGGVNSGPSQTVYQPAAPWLPYWSSGLDQSLGGRDGGPPRACSTLLGSVRSPFGWETLCSCPTFAFKYRMRTGAWLLRDIVLLK